LKVFIVGGTGFLGYYSVLEFLKRGYEVTTISLPDIELGEWFPKEVEVKYGNIFKMPDEKLIEYFKGFDAMVYAVGPDDRYLPDAPAYEFFYDRLVISCGKVVTAAKNAGVKRCVVLNSYFAYFHRLWPEENLIDRHPYIKCRVEQADYVIQAGGDSMDVMVLELPYIFGTMPERTPLWQSIFLDKFKNLVAVFFTKGGTNMLSVEHVAEAVVGAIENGKHGGKYPVGDVNMEWKEMLTLMMKGLKWKKKIFTIPTFLATWYGAYLVKKEKKQGKEHGLNARHLFNDIQAKNLFFDPSETAELLGYGRGGIEESILKTMEACYQD
jgi:nucleoside-diphosphate-sugar epimerase